MLSTFVFLLLALLCIGSALLTVILANPVTCALSLIVCLVSLAGLFAQLTAGYVAVLQVLVYVGAIMVLFLFVVMLLNLSAEEAAERPYGSVGVLKMLGCVAFLIDLWVLADISVGHRLFPSTGQGYGGLQAFGELLFTRYLVAFEVTSILLTAAVVGVVLVTRKEKPPATDIGQTHPGSDRGKRQVEGLSS